MISSLQSKKTLEIFYNIIVRLELTRKQRVNKKICRNVHNRVNQKFYWQTTFTVIEVRVYFLGNPRPQYLSVTSPYLTSSSNDLTNTEIFHLNSRISIHQVPTRPRDVPVVPVCGVGGDDTSRTSKRRTTQNGVRFIFYRRHQINEKDQSTPSFTSRSSGKKSIFFFFLIVIRSETKIK